jgi:hypothetical protein
MVDRTGNGSATAVLFVRSKVTWADAPVGQAEPLPTCFSPGARLAAGAVPERGPERSRSSGLGRDSRSAVVDFELCAQWPLDAPGLGAVTTDHSESMPACAVGADEGLSGNPAKGLAVRDSHQISGC